MNETAVRQLGWDSQTALGKRFEWPFLDRKGRIIGVVNDFNSGSLRDAIKPTFLVFRRNKQGNLLVKIADENISDTMAHLKKTWLQFMLGKTFEAEFLDDRIRQMYRGEQQLGEIFRVFFVLAIFIACLGLLALATFMAEQRGKEIGIRKSVGADVRSIVLLLARGFMKPVAAASVVGWPIAWWVMSDWLNGFAYRIDLGPAPFVAGAAVSIAVAMVTVTYQAVRAARVNPVDVLRE